MEFIRPVLQTVLARLNEPRRFIQVLAGPRQVGKTTLAYQAAKSAGMPMHYASADDPNANSPVWIQQQWNIARFSVQEHKTPALFILDEVQKIMDWSGVVKQLWDEDTAAKLPLKVIILGSAPLLIQRGLSESLAGRFEMIPITHWSYNEMQQAFDWSWRQYVYFGGYPGAAPLIEDEPRWKRYIIDSLIETTLAKDILSITPIQKPALLRNLFYLGCAYSGQVLSYQKMMGQLHDVGNTTTLAHYLELLTGAGLVTGLSKYSGQIIRQRGSSPKLQVLNTGLMSAPANYSFTQKTFPAEYWGRLLESAVGAYLLNARRGTAIELLYWREGNHEVDFVLRQGKHTIALEIKGGNHHVTESGMNAFVETFKPQRVLLIGEKGLAPEVFFSTPIENLF